MINKKYSEEESSEIINDVIENISSNSTEKITSKTKVVVLKDDDESIFSVCLPKFDLSIVISKKTANIKNPMYAIMADNIPHIYSNKEEFLKDLQGIFSSDVSMMLLAISTAMDVQL